MTSRDIIGGVPERIRRSRGRIVLTFFPAEVEVLRDLAGQLDALFEGGVPARGEDPLRDRLFPRAYLDPTEDEAEEEWQGVVHGDLVRSKSEALAALVDSLDAAKAKRGDTIEVTLAPEEVEQWVVALNDVRLALGVVLEVSEEDAMVSADDPRAPGLELYAWLTWLQGGLIETLTGEGA
jgi:hypothetical protein